MDAAHLEDYVRTARVLHATPLAGGGGHGNKQVLVLDGGLGVVAKLAEAPDPSAPDPTARAQAAKQVRAEVAAWLLACELGWPDLVPVTMLGVVESLATREHVAASLQVVWPRFKMAGELTRAPADCSEDDQWRVAIFDAIAANTDRNATNWGFVDGLHDFVKLIDHGNAFDPAGVTTSEFALPFKGQAIPEVHLGTLRAFEARAGDTRLSRVLDHAAKDAVVARAHALGEQQTLVF